MTDRSEIDAARSAGGERAPRRTEHARQDAEADRCLVALARAGAAGQERAQRAQCGRLVLVAPQRLQVGAVGILGRADRVAGQREHPLGERDPLARGERDIGHERRGARRAVDQRHPLLGRQLERAR